MPPGVSKIAGGAAWPDVSEARLTFVDEETKKPYEIKLVFPHISEAVRSGRCHKVTIEILSYERAHVIWK